MQLKNKAMRAPESAAEEKGAQHTLTFLWPLLRPYKAHIAGAVGAIVVAASTMLTLGWGLRSLIDFGLSRKDAGYLDQALLLLLGIILLLATASYVRFYLMNWVAERVIADLRKKIFQHLLSLDTAYFETHKTGDAVSRINTDTSVLQMAVTTNFPSAFRHALMLLGGIGMLFVVSPGMTGMVMLSVPFIVLPVIYFGRRVRAKSRETQSRIGDMGAYSVEALQGLQTIQSFGYEKNALRLFARHADDAFALALKYVRVRAFLTAFVIAVVLGAIGIVLWQGGHRVLAGEMSAGDLSAFIFYSVMVAGAIGTLSEAMGAFHQATGAADRIISLLNAKPVLKNTGVSLAKKIAGNIRFDNVSFSYPARMEQRALEDASFDVLAGDIVALVGPSGAGKTTVFQLLQRFYDPLSGNIFFDEENITDYSPESIRQHLSVVSQDPAVFSTTIADNIRMGIPEATDTEVREAAELAQAHEFIKALPQGYDTLVGERGSRLSGGQRQRVAIARALLKNPKILLLDEATSALDAPNEQAVHFALKSLMKGRTTLIIAHRLSTVQNADKIIVLDKGRVQAVGSHRELQGKDSLYTHLAGLQADVA